jgi:glycosyltransferase involved in cell wall biosynthesis
MSNNPLVSVIVPSKNSSEFIENCLKSIKNQSYKNIEMVVIDNNSSDNTKEIAKKYTKFVFNKGPERSAQRNFGALKSSGKYFLFIDSDMELSKNVIRECVKKSSKYNVLIIPEKSFGKGFWAKCKALERSFYLGIDWIESARFFEVNLFKEFKGYDLRNTGTEDFDLPQRIKNKYGRESVGRVKSFIMHNEGSASLIRTLGKKYYYSKKLAVYKINNETYFKKQANIFSRYILFFRNPRKLFNKPEVGIGMLLMKTMEFIVGGIGYLSTKYEKN